MLTQEHLREVLTYHPDTGLFCWKASPVGTIKAGSVAGSFHSNGYRQISIDGRRYYAHRLTFLYMEGAMPPAQVDHVNGVRDDNRWCNLRHATPSQNSANTRVRSVLGVKGVARNHKRFKATIQINGQNRYLGTFDTIAEAAAAYERAANDLHGQFARTA